MIMPEQWSVFSYIIYLHQMINVVITTKINWLVIVYSLVML